MALTRPTPEGRIEIQHRDDQLPLPRYSIWSKLSLLAMAMPRPWVSNARSGSKFIYFASQILCPDR